jgi:ribonuclease VapC
MIIDASALIAILRDEPEARTFAKAIASTNIRRVSAVNYVEAAAVIDASRNPVASRRFDDLLREAQLIIETVTEAQARIAREAYRDFGKGSRHPAGLNFGDCFAYALAKATGEPILFKGDDF